MKFQRPDHYQPRAHEVFTDIKKRLHQIMPELEVEHIGSSAIAGAISKGDLDVLVRVHKKNFRAALVVIEDLGFSIKKDTLRTPALCMLETRAYDIDTAIQLIEKGSEFEMFTIFRDRLNADPALVKEYNKLKQSLEGTSPEEYRRQKSLFIQRVLN